MSDIDEQYHEEQPNQDQSTGMRNGILCQVFGNMGQQAFVNGVILVYLVNLSISDSRIAFYLAIPLGLSILAIYLAHYADRVGKKSFGIIGAGAVVIGYLAILVASFVPVDFVEIATVTGIVIYGIGNAFFGSQWFALMNPVVPANMRGRFWGKLRLSWQGASILFAIIAGVVLTKDAPLYLYRLVIGVVAAALAMRIVFYSKIPEMDAKKKNIHYLMINIQCLRDENTA